MKTEEVWKDIPGYEGTYQVSSHGRVRSLDRYVFHWKAGKDVLRRGGLLKPGTVHGYKQVTLCYGGVREQRKVHQLVLEAFVGPRPSGAEVMHEDNDPSNNHLDNLSYGTESENQRHCTICGRRSTRRLTDEAVLEIREELKAGMSLNSVGRKHGVTGATIKHIQEGRSYAWLT